MTKPLAKSPPPGALPTHASLSTAVRDILEPRSLPSTVLADCYAATLAELAELTAGRLALVDAAAAADAAADEDDWRKALSNEGSPNKPTSNAAESDAERLRSEAQARAKSYRELQRAAGRAEAAALDRLVAIRTEAKAIDAILESQER